MLFTLRLRLLCRIVLLIYLYIKNCYEPSGSESESSKKNMSHSVDLVSSTNAPIKRQWIDLSARARTDKKTECQTENLTFLQKIGRFCICGSGPSEMETLEDLLQIKNKLETVLELNSEHKTKVGKVFDTHGYLLLLEEEKNNTKKKSGELNWVKRYGCYRGLSKMLLIIEFDLNTHKIEGVKVYDVVNCTPRAIPPYYFAFDLNIEPNLYGPEAALTLQACTDDDERQWFEAFGCRHIPSYGPYFRALSNEITTYLNRAGFAFIKKCIAELEVRGLTERGLYKLPGVASKAKPLVRRCLSIYSTHRGAGDTIHFITSNISVANTHTITAAIKMFFRNLPYPLLSFPYREPLIRAAKIQNEEKRYRMIEYLILTLPRAQFKMLKMMIIHLEKVTIRSDVNEMTIRSIAKALGSAFLRCEIGHVENIKDVEYCYRVIEILIENADSLFKGRPPIYWRNYGHGYLPVPDGRFMRGYCHCTLVARNIALSCDESDSFNSDMINHNDDFGFSSKDHNHTGKNRAHPPNQRSPHVEKNEQGTSVWTWREKRPRGGVFFDV